MSAAARRWLLWGACLVATLWAAWQLSAQSDVQPPVLPRGMAVSDAKRPLPRALERPAEERPGSFVLPVRDPAVPGVRDLFALPSTPPKPASQTMQAAVVPVAVPPVFPYKYVGRLEEGGTVKVFLTEGDETLVVAPGEIASKGWRLVAVESNRLDFVFDPLGFKQTLQTGAN